MDLSSRLQSLAELRDAGYLTTDEFEQQRAALVAAALDGGTGGLPASTGTVAPAWTATGTQPGGLEGRGQTARAPRWRGWLPTLLLFGCSAALVALLSYSSSPSSTSPETACVAAFRDASDGRVEAVVEYDLDPAIRVCSSIAAWTDAWRRYPPSAGNDPRLVAENRCLTGKFSSTAICRELGITP